MEADSGNQGGSPRDSERGEEREHNLSDPHAYPGSDKGDIRAQIAMALENYSPYITQRIQETMERAVNTTISLMIKETVKEELDKRLPPNRDEGARERANDEAGGDREVVPRKDYTYKNFTVCNPPTYNGDPDPMVSTRWISEIEGSFRITECPMNLRTRYGTSMLRGAAKRWWDDLVRLKGEEPTVGLSWNEFKSMFFKAFRSEAEVTRLRSEFLNTKQGSLDLSTFRTQFLDKAQFYPEYLNNDNMLKELFHDNMRKELSDRISLQKVDSFIELYDVARGFEVKMMKNEPHSQKRKTDQTYSPSKKFKGGGDPKKGTSNTPPRVCFSCGKPGHIARECTVAVSRPTICFHCNREGHRKAECPSLSEAERKEEQRKEAVRRLERAAGNPRGRSFQMTVDEAKKSSDVVSGTFLINSKPARVMFDSGANRSFVATRFASCLEKMLSSLESPLEVEIADGKTMLVVGVYKDCNIDVDSKLLSVDLIPMTMGEFDVIIGMDWLGQHEANISCNDKVIRLKAPGGEEVVIQGEGQRRPVPICTYARARRLMSSGCVAFLAHVVDSRKEPKSIKDIPVVNEFEDVFPDELPGVPPE